ncbi:DinB family protein [Alisedimentitalea sp. MJ-SS2]|uniref:DinB family protein n=1 Tax=Aliisedimentitalea sp. MJ-SS2 TaxID=3049795 RepID=UPI0029157B21|nr:DinB family protein [Alisedimentitalea sp. MJ-SS2]MDU8929197.1 DinB family protein [Alisedimentitalea sp. MJ-SS2]
MIDSDYVKTMARYNDWQNRQMETSFAVLSEEALQADRGAFFGSIQGTLSHLLWGDWIWMSRFDGGDGPEGGIPDSAGMILTFRDWAEARDRMDARILRWAEGVSTADLAGDLTWFSGAAGFEVSRPLAMCVTHMFNHQTHHRGQLHSMATATGAKDWVSDLFLMPEEGDWQ